MMNCLAPAIIFILYWQRVTSFLLPEDDLEKKSVNRKSYGRRSNIFSSIFENINHQKKSKRGSSRISYSECQVSAFERMDCGYYGISESQCNSRDCCWQESVIPGVPWCFHTHTQSEPTCYDVSYEERTDCGFYGIKAHECRASGCCWRPVPDQRNNKNIPWCFQPKNSGSTFDGRCGQPVIAPSVNQRIVGGREAIAHSWPWQVSLQLSSGHFCGGSLIAPNWILSAAHCDDAFDYYDYDGGEGNKIVIGLHDKNNPDGQEIEVNIVERIIHEEYGVGHSTNNDILLIRIDREIEYNDRASPVCLPRANQVLNEDAICYTTGWGHLESGGYMPNKLQQVMVPPIDRQTCNQPSWYGGEISEAMICAGFEHGGKDSCQGDSGGPYVCLMDGRWTLAGIVSWGYGCADALKPGIYTNTAMFIDWIQEKMENSIRSQRNFK